MIIYYDNRFETVNFGMRILRKSLEKRNIFFLERFLKDFTGNTSEKSIVACLEGNGDAKASEKLEKGGFAIAVRGKAIYIIAREHTGLMYGLMDMAETIDLFGENAVVSKEENPFLKMRGIKYNLPFEPYDTGDPFEKNIKTCLDTEYWREYIDFLAMNRYNVLSLWSEHPFHMMFRLEKYPEACPYSEVELETCKNLFKFIFGYAKKRGIEVYLITWNIRLTPFIAKALGLPAELGDMGGRYDWVYDSNNSIPNHEHEFDVIRQSLDVVKDYFKECIKTLIMTYKDLGGLGTSCSEEMAGSIAARQAWVAETYMEAVKETGKAVPFIHRTNSSNGKMTKELFIDRYPGKDKYISWKYSNAHMYSHPEPEFERLWGAWDGIDLEDTRILYTLRNDDFHTLRWGDPAFVKAYFKGMHKPYVHGYYWGADGYIWGDDFQHVPHRHKTWKYDFQRHWYAFELLGRLGYNPETEDRVWVGKFKKHYGEPWGEKLFTAMKAASKIIPAVNRLFWINYDFEWHPESLLSVFGFKSILDFMDGSPMPGIGTVGIREYVENTLKGVESKGETPVDIINIIGQAAARAGEIVNDLQSAIPSEYLDGDTGCTISDLRAWQQLGNYYANKFTASMELVHFENTGDAASRDRAVSCLEKGLDAWKKLSEIWSGHYMPYKMVRSKHIFGWSYYIEEVRRDIEIARNMEGRCT